ncbi:MAG: glycosyltransferase family 2 protein [Dokdonella sp.]
MSDRTEFPLVSIGMPVYNEARFIDASLTSLRRQDYPNLEILICDNASTDDTVAICERHAAADARIRIERWSENRGAIANFQRSLDLAKGIYFMWASGHDVWTDNLVSACAALLNANDGASIAFGTSNWIDGDGRTLARVSGWTDTRGVAPAARLLGVFWGNMHPILGLIRTTHLRSCPPMPNITGCDLVVLAELALRGDFIHATDALWSRREFRVETRYEDKLRRYASATTGIGRSRFQRAFPLVNLPIALMRVVMRSTLTIVDKMLLLPVLLVSFPLRYRIGRRAKVE